MLPRRRREVPEPPLLDDRVRGLVDDHGDAVFRLAMGILHDRGLAEDVVQETMVRAWEALPTFRGEGSLRSWVLTIGHHTAVSALRRRRDRATAPEDLPDRPGSGADDPAARVDGRDRLVRLAGALDDLDELSRSVVILRETEGLDYATIATVLDVPVSTVRTRLLRARRALRAAVDDEPGRPGPPVARSMGHDTPGTPHPPEEQQ